MRAPTYEQQAILQAAADGHDLIKVSAGAGTGKTTSTQWLAGVPRRRSGGQLYSQFAVMGGEDAAARLAGSGVICKRPGQLAWAAAAPWQRDRLNSSQRMKSADVAEAIGLSEKWVQDSTMMVTAAAWTAMMRATVVRFCQSAREQVEDQHVPPGVRDSDVAEMVRAAQWLWDTQLNRESGMVPYTMDHCKKHWSLKCPRYRYSRIMVDEAQDTNPCDLHVYKNQDTQLIVIGDTQQQLYEWRGAVDALSDETLPGGLWLPLSQSFRFGPEIAAVANRFLTLLDARFRLTGLGPPGRTGQLLSANAVLCRTNAECMRAAIDHLQAGRKVALAGKTRDELLALARGAMALRSGRRSEHPALISFRTWRGFCEYAENDPDGRDYLTLVRLVTAHGEQLVRHLELMTDGPADVVCATVWKAKGMEWPAVMTASDFWPGEEGGFNEELAAWWLSGDRRNPFLRVCYVAVTRAQTQLDSRSLSWI
jgi:hypothetical protein